MQDPRQRIAAAIEAAEAELSAAYWVACDAVGAAIDPEDLTTSTWACEYLADAYDIALCIEADGESWADARTRF